MKKIYVVTENSDHFGEMPLIAYTDVNAALNAIKKFYDECECASSDFDYYEVELAE